MLRASCLSQDGFLIVYEHVGVAHNPTCVSKYGVIFGVDSPSVRRTHPFCPFITPVPISNDQRVGSDEVCGKGAVQGTRYTGPEDPSLLPPLRTASLYTEVNITEVHSK